MTFNTQPVTVTARKTHRCTACGELIEKGETYHRWVTFDDTAGINKMHPECLASLQAGAARDGCGSNWEYTLYSYERPKVE